MAITTSEGARVYICTTPTSATTESALAALTYVEVGKVESVGEFGPQAQDVTFTPLSGPAVQHLKGATDYGSLAIVCARDPLDTGQNAMRTASGTKFEYAIKVVLADGADSNDTDTAFYCRGPVMSDRKNVGDANTVTKTTFNVGINVFVEDTSTAVSGS